jgi:ferrous iron transport protein B
MAAAGLAPGMAGIKPERSARLAPMTPHPDEAVVQRFLHHTPPDLLLVVLNASQIASQLRFLLQLRAMAIPTVVALNMSDESRRFGISIDASGLGEALGLPVLAVSARRNQGIHELIDRVHQLGEGLCLQGPG